MILLHSIAFFKPIKLKCINQIIFVVLWLLISTLNPKSSIGSQESKYKITHIVEDEVCFF